MWKNDYSASRLAKFATRTGTIICCFYLFCYLLSFLYFFRPEYNLPVPVPLETASHMEEVRLYNEQKKAAMAAGQQL